MNIDTNVMAVVGGGAKAAAIAAKARVLRDRGYSAPTVVIYEQNEVGGNWTGRNGFTTGLQRLGTPPEKDIGFPYHVDCDDAEVTRQLFAEYSWLSYDIFKTKRFADWIDRGRPHPEHREWANYLSWVIRKSGARVVNERVSAISANGAGWLLGSDDGRRTEATSVVITGPGLAKRFSHDVPRDEMIVAGDEFWQKPHLLSRLHVDGVETMPVVVVGGGETAASIVNHLLKRVDSRVPILVLTRSGAIFTRGEGYYENRMFTDFQAWKNLPPHVREDVIRRGDRGVFSVDVIRAISNASNVDHRFCEIKEVKRLGECHFQINGLIDCQMIVVALGFDPEWFVELLDERTRNLLARPIRASIQNDLSVHLGEGTGKLFTPMLAGFAQGPGFPNLSCLGTLSDRVLGRIAGA